MYLSLKVMCAMYMLCKTGMVCLQVADPHFIFDHICVRIIQTHMHCLLLEYLELALKKVLSLCTIHIIPTILSGGKFHIWEHH